MCVVEELEMDVNISVARQDSTSLVLLESWSSVCRVVGIRVQPVNSKEGIGGVAGSSGSENSSGSMSVVRFSGTTAEL